MTRSKNREPSPLGKRLREQRRLRGWSQEQFAAIAQIGESTVAMYELGDRTQHDRDIVIKIAKAMNEPVQWWLDAAGLPYQDSTPEQYRQGVAAAIDLDPRLSRKQKAAMHALYDSFFES